MTMANDYTSCNRRLHKFFDDIVGRKVVTEWLWHLHYGTWAEKKPPRVDKVVEEIEKECGLV